MARIARVVLARYPHHRKSRAEKREPQFNEGQIGMSPEFLLAARLRDVLPIKKANSQPEYL